MIKNHTTIRPISLSWALVPIIYLVALLSINIAILGEDALGGSSQLILMSAALLCSVVAHFKANIRWRVIEEGMSHHIKESTPAILILFMIGALSGTWMISGVVPTLIYYGLKLISPTFFLVSTCLLCAIVSVAAGSSWTTVATIGIAMMGVAQAMGFPTEWVAGAIISGAYFGDKISPMSDTTNLASGITGTPLFTHIRYMMQTTIPAFIIALIIYTIAGFTLPSHSINQSVLFSQALQSTFFISPWLLLIPTFTFFLIIKKIPAFIVIFLSAIIAGITALIVQPELCASIGNKPDNQLASSISGVLRSAYGAVSITSGHELLDSLIATRGMSGMLNTVWLIIAAMSFGGALEAGGMLKTLSAKVMQWMTNRFTTVGTTTLSCLFLNLTTGDQFIAIILPGKMFAHTYRIKLLPSKLLSRTIEDSATVTSVLIPWNTCGMTQATILGVSTLIYLPFCFFNLLSPLCTLFAALVQNKNKSQNE